MGKRKGGDKAKEAGDDAGAGDGGEADGDDKDGGIPGQKLADEELDLLASLVSAARSTEGGPTDQETTQVAVLALEEDPEVIVALRELEETEDIEAEAEAHEDEAEHKAREARRADAVSRIAKAARHLGNKAGGKGAAADDPDSEVEAQVARDILHDRGVENNLERCQ